MIRSKRCLAGAGGPEQRQQLAGRDIEAHAAQRGVAIEVLGDLLGADRHGHAPAPSMLDAMRKFLAVPRFQQRFRDERYECEQSEQ